MNIINDMESVEEMFAESVFLADVTVTMFYIDLRLYFYRSHDGKLVLISECCGFIQKEGELNKGEKTISTDLFNLVNNWIKKTAFLDGFPILEKSPFYSHKEWNQMIFNISNEEDKVRNETRKRITPIITFLEENCLNPVPSPYSVNNWTASCPRSHGKHFLVISTIPEDGWGCGYCRKKGGIKELQEWLNELKSKE